MSARDVLVQVDAFLAMMYTRAVSREELTEMQATVRAELRDDEAVPVAWKCPRCGHDVADHDSEGCMVPITNAGRSCSCTWVAA